MPPGGLSWLKPESPEQARQPQEQEQDLGWLQLKGPEGGATMAAVIYMGGKKSPSFYAAENVLHAVAGIWDVDINSTLFDADVKAALLKHPTLHEYATSFLVAKHGRFLGVGVAWSQKALRKASRVALAAAMLTMQQSPDMQHAAFAPFRAQFQELRKLLDREVPIVEDATQALDRK